MKKVILKIAVGILGAGALGAGGYFGWRWWKQHKAEADANVALEVEYVSDPGVYAEEDKHVVRDPDDPKRTQTDIRPETLARGVEGYMAVNDEDRENFEAYLAGMESPEEDEDDEYELEEEPDISRGAEGPYRITAGEFCNNRTYYDKVSVNYFADDNVIADDRDEVMENAQRILGDLQSAFDAAGSPSVLYIRNEALEVDYEVSFVDGNFRRDVLRAEG